MSDISLKTSKGRHAKMHVGHSLTSYSEGSSEDHVKQSGDDGDQVRPRQTHRVLQGTAAPNRQTLVHCRAQFEDDALRDVQPVQFIVKDVHQTPIKLPSSSNDSGSSVQDPLQLVSIRDIAFGRSKIAILGYCSCV